MVEMRDRMNVREKRNGFRFMLCVCLTVVMCLGMISAAQAKITGIGKPSRQTYVKAGDKSQVIIYAGDSRVMFCTCGKGGANARNNYAMCFVNGGNASVISLAGGKLTSRVAGYIEKYRSRKPVVVFNFGLNGNSYPEKNAKRIIRIYNNWMKKYPDLQFYVESIGPTKVGGSGPYSNRNVILLNELLRQEYEPKGIWLDTNQFIVENDIVNSSGKGLRDDYHFKWSTSRRELLKIRELVETDLKAKQEAKEAEEKKAREKAAAEKTAAEKTAAEKTAAEKTAAEKTAEQIKSS